MPKIPLCNLGKSIKRRLDDLGETQKWLIEQVRKDTGLFFDEWYLYKILTGKIATRSMIASICKILEIEDSGLLVIVISSIFLINGFIASCQIPANPHKIEILL